MIDGRFLDLPTGDVAWEGDRVARAARQGARVAAEVVQRRQRAALAAALVDLRVGLPRRLLSDLQDATEGTG